MEERQAPKLKEIRNECKRLGEENSKLEKKNKGAQKKKDIHELKRWRDNTEEETLK